MAEHNIQRGRRFGIYYPQIDYIKGLAILSVIVLHTVPIKLLVGMHADLHIWQAVPVFFIMMGITSHLSFSKKGKDSNIKSLYSNDYIFGKLGRFLLPFLPICVIDLVAAIFMGRLDGQMVIVPLAFVGVLPVGLPGGYFVTLLLQFVILAPVIYMSMKRYPVATLVSLFLLDLAFELLAPSMPYSLYYYSFARFLFAAGLGFYVAGELLNKQRLDLQSRSNAVLLVLAFVSMVYLALFHGSYFPYFRPEWRNMNVLSFFYPLMLVVLLFTYYDSISRFTPTKLIRKLGAASYHIFLVQMVYFGLFNMGSKIFAIHPSLMSGVLALAINLLVCCVSGSIYYEIDSRGRRWFKGHNSRESLNVI